MTNRAKRIQTAIKAVKSEFDGCISTGMNSDGAHIIPRDVRPDLADNVVNIIPLCRVLHQAFDRLPSRDIDSRIEFLLAVSSVENLGKVRHKLEKLREIYAKDTF